MGDFSGMEYFFLAGIGAVIGLILVGLVVFPLSLIWPAFWDAAIWVIILPTAIGVLIAWKHN